MKKVLTWLGMMLFSACAFALNAQAPAGEDCHAQRAAFEQHVNSQSNNSFIVQYILINLADPAEELTDEQVTPLAQCYIRYQVKGTSMVDFVRANATIFRQKAKPEEQNAAVFDDLEMELLRFANRVERLGEQAELDRIAAGDNDDHVVQHILNNLADPMAQMTDEQAAPKAKVYKQLKVNRQPLVEFALQQASRFGNFAPNVEEDLNSFANRVNKLAQ